MKKNKMDTQEYQFIKETVKKQPKENGSLLCRLLMIAGCGVLFGGCAALTFASVFPVMADREENTQQRIELTDSDAIETAEKISEEKTTEKEDTAFNSEKEKKSPLAMRQETYKEVMKEVYTTSVNEQTLDEAPMAYKSLEDIIDVVSESVDVVEVMKPVFNFKAS